MSTNPSKICRATAGNPGHLTGVRARRDDDGREHRTSPHGPARSPQIMTAQMQPRSPMPDPAAPFLQPRPRGHVGWIVAGSLTAGLVAALTLVAAPFIPAEGNAVTGAVLCGFALGWAMLAVLSVRFTDQPQRWAAAPALVMGAAGLLLMGFGSSVGEQLGWVWPPAMLATAGWMIVGAHRHLRSPARRWL